MSALHDWHRDVFAKRHDVTISFPSRPTQFGGPTEAVSNDTTMGSARACICQRVVNGLSPAEWTAAQDAFDSSDEGQALTDKDPSVRREHCELWLLKSLYEADHPELVPASELARLTVLEHHAQPKFVAAHKARLVAHVKDGKPLHGVQS